MNQRKPLPEELDPQLDELEPRLRQAIAATDGPAIARVAEEIWDILPRPLLEWETQGMVGWCTDSLERAGNWEAMRVWMPRYAEQYPPNYPSTRVREGVLAYHTGRRAEAQEILAGVLDEFGPTVFEGRREYLRVAKGGQLP